MLERFRQVVHFASNASKCRHAQVAEYFEEILLENHPAHPRCCDNCGPSSACDYRKEADLVVRIIEKVVKKTGRQPLIALVCDLLRAKVAIVFTVEQTNKLINSLLLVHRKPRILGLTKISSSTELA
jgi:hypothetical protein